MPSDTIVELINQKYAVHLNSMQVSQFRMETFAQFNNSANLIAITNQMLKYYFQEKNYQLVPVAQGHMRYRF